MEQLFPFTDEDEGWRCRKHLSAQPRTGGICPVCLRARLLRLCPECAGERPRGCSCPSTSSAASPPRSGAAAGARVSHLAVGEPALRRSRSAAFHLAPPRSDEAASAEPPRPRGGGVWSWLWPFARGKKADKGEAKDPPEDAAPVTRLSRSRSVAVVSGACPGHGVAIGGGNVRWKGWSRYLPIPVKSTPHRRTSKVIQA